MEPILKCEMCNGTGIRDIGDLDEENIIKCVCAIDSSDEDWSGVSEDR